MMEGIRRKDNDKYQEEKECWPPLRKASRNAYVYKYEGVKIFMTAVILILKKSFFERFGEEEF